MQPAIRVDNLSKVYRVNRNGNGGGDLREALTSLVKAPLHRLRHGPAHGVHSEEFWALKDVSFEVQPGEILGVIGANGAGKSTLLKILSHITEPTSGRVEIRGRVACLLEVGTGFHPELSGRENVYLNGAILGMSKREIDRKFDEIVDFSGVENFLDTPVKRYSSGMRIRLGFAVAAHLDPEILIVDEVLAVGDAEFQKRCLGKMNDVAKSGRTVLFVSHNMAAMSQLCHSVAWVDHGRIRTHGDSSSIVRDYLSHGTTATAQCRWNNIADAPGDSRVRLLAARILQNDDVAPVIDINCDCKIEIDFAVLEEVEDLISGVNFYDSSGTCLFASCDWKPNNLSPGEYNKSVEIPAHTFAEGTISVLVQLVFYRPDIKSVVVPDAFSFDASDSDHPDAVRGHYKGDWPGVLRLNLRWSQHFELSSTLTGQ